MKISEELEKPEVAATAGAVAALVVATMIPAALLLTVGVATVGGVYLYNWKFSGDGQGKPEPTPNQGCENHVQDGDKPGEDK